MDYRDHIYVPTIIPNLININYIASGNCRSAVITKDIYIFGMINNNILDPTLISNDNNIVKIAFGSRHALALTDNGKIYVFGDNRWGQLGLGDNNDHNDIYTLKSLENFNNIIEVATGDCHSLILMNTGQVYSFGNNFQGCLGLGNIVNKNRPTLIENFTNIVKIAAGHYHSLILTEDKQIYSFGGDLFSIPLLTRNFNNVIDISARNINCLILTQDNQIYGFKNNEIVLTHKFIEPINNISCGNGHALISMKDGKIYSVGNNAYGQLGLGDTINRDVPELIKMNL